MPETSVPVEDRSTYSTQTSRHGRPLIVTGSIAVEYSVLVARLLASDENAAIREDGAGRGANSVGHNASQDPCKTHERNANQRCKR